jgi:hypothetical protein
MSSGDYFDHRSFRGTAGWRCGSTTVVPLEPWVTSGAGRAELDEMGRVEEDDQEEEGGMRKTTVGPHAPANTRRVLVGSY